VLNLGYKKLEEVLHPAKDIIILLKLLSRERGQLEVSRKNCVKFGVQKT